MLKWVCIPLHGVIMQHCNNFGLRLTIVWLRVNHVKTARVWKAP